MKCFLVYVTCGTQAEAKEIASDVVEQRLAACANVFQPHDSVYWWDGAVQNSQEVTLVLKTTSEKFEALKGKVVALHSYDVPCIVALPIEEGYGPFLQWVGAMVEPSADSR